MGGCFPLCVPNKVSQRARPAAAAEAAATPLLFSRPRGAEPWPPSLSSLPPPAPPPHPSGSSSREGVRVLLEEALVQNHWACPTCQPTSGRAIFPEAFLPPPPPPSPIWKGAQTQAFLGSSVPGMGTLGALPAPSPSIPALHNFEERGQVGTCLWDAIRHSRAAVGEPPQLPLLLVCVHD